MVDSEVQDVAAMKPGKQKYFFYVLKRVRVHYLKVKHITRKFVFSGNLLISNTYLIILTDDRYRATS